MTSINCFMKENVLKKRLSNLFLIKLGLIDSFYLLTYIIYYKFIRRVKRADVKKKIVNNAKN